MKICDSVNHIRDITKKVGMICDRKRGDMKLNIKCPECGKAIELISVGLYPVNSYKCGCREMTEASVIKLLVTELDKHKEALKPFREAYNYIYANTPEDKIFDDNTNTPSSIDDHHVLKVLHFRRAAEVYGGSDE